MGRFARASLLLSGVLAASPLAAAEARADDNAEVRKLVQAEIKATMDKKKEDDARDLVFKAKWKDGLLLQTADKQFSLRIGGRIHLDTVFTKASDTLQGPPPGGLGAEFDGATFLRRAQLSFSGDLGEHVDYRLKLEFASPNNPQFKDAYITLKNLKACWGCWAPSIRVGQQWDPVGLEAESSTNHLALIERSTTNDLSPQRALGLALLDHFWHDHATAELGVFSTSQTDDDSGFGLWDQDDADGGEALTGRFTLIPWARDTCHFLHVGLSASYRNPNSLQFRARPGLGRGPRVVDTGVLTGLDRVLIGGAELALVLHGLHAAAEYVRVDVRDPPRGDPSFDAWYVQAGWFLTGEAKAYDFEKGLWANTPPCCDFLGKSCCCWGAVELVARYDTLDLNGGTVQGGKLRNLAVGVNWYLTAWTRLMFDVVFSKVKDRASGGVTISDESLTSFLMRWDVHF